MRFCMVTTFYPPHSFGGDATYVRNLSRSLARRGHEVIVVSCTDSYRLSASAQPVTHEQDDAGVTVIRLTSRYGALSPLITQQSGHPGLKRSALAETLAGQFDVINFHNISLIGGPGVLGLGTAPVKLYTLHEHWLLCPTHIFWKNRVRACDVKTCIRCSIRSGIPPQLWRYTGLRDRSLAHVDRLLAPSDYTARRHSSEGIERPISVLPLFSSLKAGATAPPASNSRPSFVFAGRVTASKGIEPLLRVAANMPDVDLAVVGDGDLLADLRSRYAGCGNISFPGRLPQDQLVEYYARANASLLPSLAPETFGLTIVEAAACHTPSIVSAGSGGGAEIVARTGGGIVYDGEGELIAAMQKLAHDHQYLSEMRMVAFAGYQNFYTEDRHMDLYLATVAEISEMKRLSPPRTAPCAR